MSRAHGAPGPRTVRRVAVLTNPAAGAGHSGPAAERAVARLRSRGVVAAPHPGRSAEDGRRRAPEAA
ncbi:hypothetical protein ACFV04_28365, partial [Kitasatospora sp. NPDC059599]